MNILKKIILYLKNLFNNESIKALPESTQYENNQKKYQQQEFDISLKINTPLFHEYIEKINSNTLDINSMAEEEVSYLYDLFIENLIVESDKLKNSLHDLKQSYEELKKENKLTPEIIKNYNEILSTIQ